MGAEFKDLLKAGALVMAGWTILVLALSVIF